ncbi:MAG: DNA-binding response regulator [Acidobacteria bacterium]|nr:MAG: DNA-binding response regulator [Acidobacteriota bacterium]
MSIRALIVDDEPLARQRVRLFLERHRDVEIAGECADGEEVILMAPHLAPDLLFLDVDMPRVGAFAALGALGAAQRPAVIFITAHEEFALDAFEANAVDYLVKPFSHERFDRALERARRFLAPGNEPEPEPAAPSRHRERFAVRVRGQVILIKAETIQWIGAEGNYARLYTGAESFLIRDSLQKLESQLDPNIFVRVHRSGIVNIEKVKKLVTAEDGGFSIVLQNDASVSLGPSYRDRLESFLGQKL